MGYYFCVNSVMPYCTKHTVNFFHYVWTHMTRVPGQCLPSRFLVDGERVTVVRGEEGVKALRGSLIFPRVRFFGPNAL